MQGDVATLRRAHYMYNVGFAETFQRSLAHMNQIFKRASVDPNSVGYIMRDDIARANENNIDKEYLNNFQYFHYYSNRVLTNLFCPLFV